MKNRILTFKHFAAVAGNYLAYGCVGLAFGSVLYSIFAAVIINKYVPGYNQKATSASELGTNLLFYGLLLPLLTPVPCLFLARRKPIVGAGSFLCVGLSTVVTVLAFLVAAILLTLKSFAGYC